MSGNPRARVIGRTGASAGVTHDLADEARIGRSSGNDIAINSPFLSGQHARIYTQAGSHWIEDLGSRNGTRVDGVAISQPMCLERLHVITLADAIDLVYVAAGAGVPAERAAPPPAAGRAASAGASHAATDGPAGAAPGQPPAPPSRQPETIYDLQFDPLVDPRAPAGAGKADASEREAVEGAEPGAAAPAPDATPPDFGKPEPEPEPSDGLTMILELDSGPVIDPRRAAPPAAPVEAQSPARQYALVLTLPDGATETFPLKRGENSLGRSADCDVTVPDPDRWLSRHHATLTIRDDGATLADSDTMNGTFIAGVQIRSVEIAPDTTFRLGPNAELRFVER